jgi:hypothetical protein
MAADVEAIDVAVKLQWLPANPEEGERLGLAILADGDPDEVKRARAALDDALGYHMEDEPVRTSIAGIPAIDSPTLITAPPGVLVDDLEIRIRAEVPVNIRLARGYILKDIHTDTSVPCPI